MPATLPKINSNTHLPAVFDPVENKVTERHIYVDPDGAEGFIDYEYTVSGLDLFKKATHTGNGSGKANHAEIKVDDVTEDTLVQTGTIPVDMDVVKIVETTPGSGVFDKRIIVQETHDQPVVGMQSVTTKHPYKALYFGL